MLVVNHTIPASVSLSVIYFCLLNVLRARELASMVSHPSCASTSGLIENADSTKSFNSSLYLLKSQGFRIELEVEPTL
jgi:hypothetical protein